jgi:peptidoglycan/xylan/chitin deacetylase (PgdA/CDA1 family)
MSKFAFMAAAFFVIASFSLAGPNVLSNGNMETADPRNSALALNWQSWGNGYRRSIDPAYSWSGLAYLTVTQKGTPTSYAGARRRVVLNQKVARPVRVRAMVTGFSIVDDPKDIFGASLYGEIHLMDGSIVYSKHSVKTKNVGSFDWREIGWNTGSIGIEKPIAYIDVFPMLGKVTGKAFFDDVFVEPFAAELGLPAVTFMFDDGYKSVRKLAEPAMAAYGFKGTVAAIINELNDTDQNYMRLTDLRYLRDRGWTIASHSVTHRSLPTLSNAQVEDELYDSAAYFYRNGLSVFHFALPFGDYNQRVWGFAQWYYVSARGVERADNPYGILPFDIRIQECEYNTSAAQVSSWLAHAKANRRWLILLFHNITPTVSSKDIYAVSTARFKETVTQVKATGIRVLTYDQAFDEFESKF